MDVELLLKLSPWLRKHKEVETAFLAGSFPVETETSMWQFVREFQEKSGIGLVGMILALRLEFDRDFPRVPSVFVVPPHYQLCDAAWGFFRPFIGWAVNKDRRRDMATFLERNVVLLARQSTDGLYLHILSRRVMRYDCRVN